MKYSPCIGKNVYIDPSSQIIGQVKIGDYSSVWPLCTVRGDIHSITIGHHTNIQDNSVLHVESNQGLKIGNYVTVGHQVILHACTVDDQTLVGMGSIVLDGAMIGKGVILGAGSLVTQGQKLESGYLYFGRPAKQIRKLSAKEIAGLKAWAERYVKLSLRHSRGQFSRFDFQNLFQIKNVNKRTKM